MGFYIVIIEHTEEGRITHIVNDPVPPGLEEFMTKEGKEFISFPPTALPDEPMIDPSTGTIVVDDDGQAIMVPGGTKFVECDIKIHYILDGAIVERPTFHAPALIEIGANGTDEAVIDLPDPCLVVIDGEEHLVTGGTLSVTSDMQAEYTICLVQWPYIPKEVRVVAK